MGRLRSSIRGLVVAVAIVGFDAAAMTRAIQQGRLVGSAREYAIGFGLVLLVLNLVALGLWRSFGGRPPGGRLRSTPSPVMIAALYLAVLAAAILSVLFLSPGRF